MMELSRDLLQASSRVEASRTQEVIRIGYLLRELVRLEDEIEIRIAELLLEMMERRAWRCLGYAGLPEYAEERLGLGRTAAHWRVRLARALRQLPLVRAAYEAGRIGMTEADWIVRYVRAAKRNGTRVSDAALQEAGIARAETTTAKRLGDERRMLQQQDLEDLIALARHESVRRIGRRRPLPAGSAGEAPDTAEQSGETTLVGTNALGGAAHDGSAAVAASPGVAGESAVRESMDRLSAARESATQEPAASESVVREAANPLDAAGGAGTSLDAASADALPGAWLFPDDSMWLASIRREPGQARGRVFGLGYALLERVSRRWALLERKRTIRLSPDLAARLRATLAVASADLSRRARLYGERITPAQEARLLPSERIALEYCRRQQPLPRWVALLALFEECVRVWDDPRAGGSIRSTTAPAGGARHPAARRAGTCRYTTSATARSAGTTRNET